MTRALLVILTFALPCFSVAQTNYSLSFNGTSSSVSIGTPIPTNSSYTKEAWVYLTSGTLARNVISSHGAPLWISDGVLMAGHGGVYNHVIDGSSFPLNRWVHVAVTHSQPAATMILYRDGVQVASRSSMPAYTSEATYIGSHNGAQSWFVGNIDEARIWGAALTEQQLKSRMYSGPAANATGLRAYYKFNQGSGTVLANNAANGFGSNGTITAGTWAGSPVSFGANAVTLDGVNDYISLGSSPALKVATNLTYEMWVRSSNWVVPSQQQISSCFQTGGYGFTLDGGTLNFYLMPSSTSTYVGVSIPQSSLTANTWYHIAGTFDGRYIRMYLNGVLAGTNDLGTTRTIRYTYPNNLLLLGAEATDAGGTDGQYFNGSIDDVRIWNVVRTQSDIYGNMNRELNPANASEVTGLLAYYTFNQGTANAGNTNLTNVLDQRGTYNATMINFAMSGAASNFTTQRPGLEVLPVHWDKFTARNANGSALMQWNTLQESNTRSFDVQHSTDGQNWSTIGVVSAAGESAVEKHYEYLHTSPAEGVNYYRLLQADLDNHLYYSAVVVFSKRSAGDGVTILNTLVTDGQLKMQVAVPSVVSLYTIDGKLLERRRLAAGLQTFFMAKHGAGVYLVESGGQGKKIVVQ